jgi:hypothetical protein
MEVEIVAADAQEAKRKAEETGLRMVMVSAERECDTEHPKG